MDPVTRRSAALAAARRRRRRASRIESCIALVIVCAILMAAVCFVPFFVMLLLGNFGATQWGFNETFAALLPAVPLVAAFLAIS